MTTDRFSEVAETVSSDELAQFAAAPSYEPTQEDKMPEPNAYAEVSIVVEGALDEEQTFTDQTILNEFLKTVEEELRNEGHEAQIYVQYHEHAPNDDCECAQYETDHHPAISITN